MNDLNKHYCYLLLFCGFLSVSCEQEEIVQTPQKSITELICEIPELSIYCGLIQQTEEFSYRKVISTNNRRTDCDSSLTIFALDNEALLNYIDNFPHWNTLADITPDTMQMIIQHHIYEGAKIWVDFPNSIQDCDELIRYSSIGYQMKGGGKWIFASNGDEIAVISSSTFQSEISFDSPIINHEYAVIYKWDQVVNPF